MLGSHLDAHGACVNPFFVEPTTNASGINFERRNIGVGIIAAIH